MPTESTDFTPLTENLVFTTSNMNQFLCMNISITDDAICEDAETFSCMLSSMDPIVDFAIQTATITILDDDGEQIHNNYCG